MCGKPFCHQQILLQKSLIKKIMDILFKNTGKMPYWAPEVRVFRVSLETGILGLSGDNADLTGSGVDESEADDNGNNVW